MMKKQSEGKWMAGFIALCICSCVLCSCTPVGKQGEISYREENGRYKKTTDVGNEKGEADMTDFDFSVFPNVSVTGAELSAMNEQELSVLYEQARYCQAMTDADMVVMKELVSEDMVFTHMSGKQQTREEYFADVEDGSLNYHTIGIEKPVVKVDGDRAEIRYTSVLNANAYGAKGTFRMGGTHHYEKRDGKWIIVNG